MSTSPPSPEPAERPAQGAPAPILIVGGGLTGLSTALHLRDEVPWQLFERDDRVGGHARTRSSRPEEGELCIWTTLLSRTS